MKIPEGIGYRVRLDDETRWQIHELRVGVGSPREAVARIIPQAGANLYSLEFSGVELLRQAEKIEHVKGVGFGMPILYPTPGLVRNGKFSFQKREFQFPKNFRSLHHIHGIVHSLAWRAESIEASDQKISLPLRLDVDEGHPFYELFPFKHTLRITYTLTIDALRIDFEVKNLDTKRVPFGVAFHPYFAISGQRENTFVEVPSRLHMKQDELSGLPSGEIEEVDNTRYDLRSPTSLDNLRLNDAYIGMVPETPMSYEVRDRRVKVSIDASEIFTHSVVYTPAGQDFFSLATLSCSGDAHNLYRQGKASSAHLLILEPLGGAGSTAEGSVTYTVEVPPPSLPPSLSTSP